MTWWPEVQKNNLERMKIGPELPDVMPSLFAPGRYQCYRYSKRKSKKLHLSVYDRSKTIYTYMEAWVEWQRRGGDYGHIYPCLSGDHWHISSWETAKRREAPTEKREINSRRANRLKRKRHKEAQKNLERYLDRYVAPKPELLTREQLHERWGWK